MGKKQFWLVVDTETTINGKVFDFAAVVVDRMGNVQTQCAIIVKEHIDEELFYNPAATKGELWTREYAAGKKAKYAAMINSGSRMVASVNAVNRWLEKANGKYAPTLTAYNVAFDAGKCDATGIDLTMFPSRFCLWHLSAAMFADKKPFRAFALQNAYFGNRTQHGNMTMKTNAEVMAHFVTGTHADEPHTALEDALYFEVPILVACLKRKDWKKYVGIPYDWQRFSIKENFLPA